VTFLPKGLEKSVSGGWAGGILSRPLIRILLLLFLLAVVAAEEYSILALQDKIARQSEELNSISVQLQTLKSERATLGEELSSMKEIAGDKKDGTTPERNN
jgi:septal ring factor EnvC (AmiA/AmiB activator)